MRKTGLGLVLALMALLGSTSLSAQGASTTGQVRGQVMGPEGQPIATASVEYGPRRVR